LSLAADADNSIALLLVICMSTEPCVYVYFSATLCSTLRRPPKTPPAPATKTERYN